MGYSTTCPNTFNELDRHGVKEKHNLSVVFRWKNPTSNLDLLLILVLLFIHLYDLTFCFMIFSITKLFINNSFYRIYLYVYVLGIRDGNSSCVTSPSVFCIRIYYSVPSSVPSLSFVTSRFYRSTSFTVSFTSLRVDKGEGSFMDTHSHTHTQPLSHSYGSQPILTRSIV